MANTIKTYTVTLNNDFGSASVSLPTGISILGIKYKRIGLFYLITEGDQESTAQTRTVHVLCNNSSLPSGAQILGIVDLDLLSSNTNAVVCIV